MKNLTLDDVLVADKLERVEIKELDAVIYLKILSWDDVEQKDGESSKDLSLRMLVSSLCNEDGTPFFESIEQARKSKLKSMQEIQKALMRVNGLIDLDDDVKN